MKNIVWNRLNGSSCGPLIASDGLQNHNLKISIFFLSLFLNIQHSQMCMITGIIIGWNILILIVIEIILSYLAFSCSFSLWLISSSVHQYTSYLFFNYICWTICGMECPVATCNTEKGKSDLYPCSCIS